MLRSKIVVAIAAAVASLCFVNSASALNFVQPAGSPYSTGELGSNSVLTGDLNGDGRDDVVTVNADFSYSAFQAGPSGALTELPGSPVTTSSYGVSGVLGDFTNDGILDLAIASNIQVVVRPGTGTGSFAGPLPAIETTTNGESITTGNFNGDANLDLAVAGSGNGTVQIIFGDGGGGMGSTVSVAGVGNGPVHVLAADFDGDGLDDFATANLNVIGSNPAPGAISVLMNQGGGAFDHASGSPFDGTDQPRRLASGDFNGDGDADLAQVARSSAAMQLLYGDGAGGFAPGTGLPDTRSNWNNSAASADFDGDGFDDVLVGQSTNLVNPVTPWAPIFMGKSGTDLVESPDGPWATTSPSSPWTVAIGDFNGDGYPDWVSGDPGGRVSVFLNVAPALTPSPASIGFGSRQAGTGPSSSQFATFTSTGTAPVSVPGGAVTITGADADQFVLSTESCSSEELAPTEQCQAEVRFNPTTAGAKTATLEVASDAGGSPATVALTGTGTPFAAVGATPEELDFGPVALNAGPTAAQTFTVESIGTTPLEIEGVTIYTSDFADFSITDDGCTGESVAPGGTCPVSIDFEPGALGERSAYMRVAHVDGAAIFPVSGEGVVNPGFTLEPATRDFGTRVTGDGAGPSRTFTLTSSGTTDLETGAVTITGAAADQFEITSDDCANRTLAPAATCEVAAAFAPTTAGEKTAALSVAIESGSGPATAVLTGSGQDPVPPPTPCEPVAIKRVAYFTPKVKRRSNTTGVRARITTAGPADVRISSKVIYRLRNRQGSIAYRQREFRVESDFVDYKVGIPKKLRAKLKRGKKVRFVITYSSKSTNPECTEFGAEKTRSVTTRIVKVFPNG